MSFARHHRSGAARLALAFACCGLALAAAGHGALADSGQARDMAAGGAETPSNPSAVAELATASTVSSGRSRGLSRATRAPTATAVLTARAPATATLEKCVTASAQIERYATFLGRMIAVPGSTEMSMRVDIEDRAPGETSFHRLEGAGAPGLGAWRNSEPGVKIFKDLKQVTNLSAPMDYRALVRFRWTDSKGNAIKREVLHTPACHEPAPEGQVGGEASTARMPSR